MATEHPGKIGPFEVSSVIGEGAMGTVYKATEPVAGEVVAIKVLRPEFVEDAEAVERFHREAEAVARLRHPNLVRIIKKEQLDEWLYFVMEFVPGTALEDVLRRRRLSLPEAFKVFKKVCSGLEAAHREKIFHRDLSPKNILVTEDLETVKIVDFGISRVESISREMGTLSTSQVSLGSLHYMAPEQAIDMRQTDHRADIYSLGVLFYEMLTGRVPVGRYSLPSAINTEVPSDVDPIVLRCLETNPGERFSSVSQLLARVERLDDQLRLGLVSEITDLQRSTSKIFLKPRRSRAARWGLTVAALLVAGAATGYLLWQRQQAGLVPVTRHAVPAPPAAPGVADSAAPSGEAADAPGPAGGAGATTRARVLVTPTDRSPVDGEESAELELAGVEVPEVPQPGAADESATVVASAAGPADRSAAAPAALPPPGADAAAPEAAASGAVADLEVARAKVDAGLFEPALDDLQALIEDGAGGNDAAVAAALLLKGEAHRKAGESGEAKAAWIELGTRFRGTDAAAEGSYRMATLEHAERARSAPREVWKAYNETIAGYPGTTWAARSLMDRAELEKAEKWRIEDAELGARVPMALISYRQMTAAFPTAAGAEQAFFELAEMYEDLRRFDLAAATWEGLGTRFPDDRRDAWWRAAQLYDSRRLPDAELAIAAYDKVPESSRHHADAQRRLARLRR